MPDHHLGVRVGAAFRCRTLGMDHAPAPSGRRVETEVRVVTSARADRVVHPESARRAFRACVDFGCGLDFVPRHSLPPITVTHLIPYPPQEERRIRKERQHAKEKQRLGKGGSSGKNPKPGSQKPPAKSENRLKRETAFLCPIEFKNDLPPVPVDWKFLRVPVRDKESYTKYNHLDLEDERRKEMALVVDLGITLDPMTSGAFRVPKERVPLHKADLALLEDGEAAKQRTGLIDKGKKVKRPDLSKALWLMNTQYISSATMPEHLGRSEQAYAKGKVEGDVDDGLSSLERQVARIEKSFAAAQTTPVHHKSPTTVKPLEVIPVLPDFDRWSTDHLHFVFDEDPCKDVEVLQNADDKSKSKAMERAIAKPFTVTTSEGPSKVLGLMLPKDPDSKSVFGADVTQSEQASEEYSWIREYKYAVDIEQDKSLGTMVFFFDSKEKTARYVELNTKISLSKRSKYAASGEMQTPVPSTITVKRSAPDEEAVAKRQKRKATLTGPQDA